MRRLPPPVPPEPVLTDATPRFRVQTFRIWELIEAIIPDNGKADWVDKCVYSIEPGTHDLIRIPNPIGFRGDWLVLARPLLEQWRKIGMAENAWRQWTDGSICDVPGHANFGQPIKWGDFEIRFL